MDKAPNNIPNGIDNILAMAAVDDKFAVALLKDRPSAMSHSGIELAETEKHVFASVDNETLSQMIEKMRKRIPEKSRPVFMRKSAAALLALVGAGLLSSGILEGCGTSHSAGIRPDAIKKDDGYPKWGTTGIMSGTTEKISDSLIDNSSASKETWE
jgi:hypothetical protein